MESPKEQEQKPTEITPLIPDSQKKPSQKRKGPKYPWVNLTEVCFQFQTFVFL